MQKHAARRLHWDFRLEWEGTLRSWAVPKGPSLDPADKRLAVEVEDHPIAYAKFEGDIPKGQYGGGHVDIWDNGTWEPVGDFAKGLKKGHLEFEMFGKKLSGRWHLVRTRMQGKQPNWLLMKSDDFAARAGADADVIDAGGADDPKRMLQAPRRAKPACVPKPKPGGAPKPRSAKSTRHARQRAARHASSRSSRRSSTRCRATKAGCTSSSTTACACCAAAMATTCAASRATASTGRTRSGPIVDALAKLEARRRLGGRRADRHRSERPLGFLAAAAHDGAGAARRAAVLHLRPALLPAARTCARCRCRERKSRLDAAFAKLPAKGPLRLADQIHSDSAELLARVCNQHLEGLVAKKIDSPYTGDRSENWLKVKCHREQEFVVGGAAFLPGRGTGTFSSLLVGVKSGKGLKYVGPRRRRLRRRTNAPSGTSASKKLARKDSPFDTCPTSAPARSGTG